LEFIKRQILIISISFIHAVIPHFLKSD